MIGKPFLLFFALVYVALLFAVAWWAERRGAWSQRSRSRVYALALGVYCSSWTFFGGVGQAVASTWSYLPIYLGPILLFLLGGSLLGKLVTVGERQKITSIADFIGSRYGKSRGLSATVTVLAIIGTLPYIALQLRGLTMAWDTVGSGDTGTPAWDLDTALVTALLMGLFAILFGTRHLEGRERNRGMVSAIALESLVKLLAFAAVAGLACWLMFMQPLASGQLPARRWDPLIVDANFLTQTLLAAAAILCLPRQFHMAVVEYQGPKDLQTARWLLPLYLLLFAMLILPIAMAGQPFAASGQLSPDSLVLSIPMVAGSSELTALAYLGGFSAATGMVIVAAVTLAVMISNELVAPVWLFLSRFTSLSAVSFGRYLRQIRALSILLLMLMGWGMHRALSGLETLTPIGLLSFAAAAQLAPALVGGLYWRGAHRYGVWAGLVAGYALWFFTLALPAVFPGQPLISEGLGGISWLRPQALFGLTDLDPLSHGVFWSLLANVVLFVLVSVWSRHDSRDLRQASAFVEEGARSMSPRAELAPTSVQVGQLHSLMQPFIGADRLDEIWQGFELRVGQRLLPDDRAPRFVLREAEAMLAGIVGSGTAQQVVELLRRNKPLKVEDIARLVDRTSQRLRFSQELLQTTVETISQGISVVDRELRLVAWNQQYRELFDYPQRLLYIGCPVERLYRHNAERGLYGDSGDLDAQVERRLQLLRHGGAHRFERRLPNGVIVEVRGTPMPGGGFVTTFTDISDYRAAVDALEENQRTLEQRVEQRTAELQSLHAAQSRFLAHTSHDLLQPINAARLFIASAQQRAARQQWPETMADISNIDSALESAEHLIGALREISRLDSGKLTPKREHFPLSDLLDGLVAEFQAIATDRGLQLHHPRSSAWVYSDRHLLRRILQNFLGNALQYTRRGRVLIGVRRRADGLEVQVLDTGPGIAEEAQAQIFEEFVRLSSSESASEKGLGLGLAIARRSAELLGHPLSLHSVPGRGTCFSILLPAGVPAQPASAAAVAEPVVASAELNGVRVLCIDNETAIVRGMQSLLEGWGCEVTIARSLEEARRHWHGAPPQLVIADYHLDRGATGIEALRALSDTWGMEVPGILISADISEAVRDSARDAGLFYLPKPVKPAALRNLVRRLAKSAR
ncbi:adaptive-response sensory-kinase SasA [Microbulbifer aestuariivivens]|uniref:histidine kinase n=1 Tax=Microbulbifer aestuariivivens TaxID=1908308 RepID=A0ABP9WNK0_9GAMM